MSIDQVKFPLRLPLLAMQFIFYLAWQLTRLRALAFVLQDKQDELTYNIRNTIEPQKEKAA